MNGVRRFGAWLSKVRRSGVLVLLYHRVGPSEADPFGLGVTPVHFAEHLDVLRARYRPIPLRQACERDLNGRDAVVVTFDDGYADNFHAAKPLLERCDVPATVFVASGYVGRDREFWWDELERLLLHPSELPETLSLSVRGTEYDWAVVSSNRARVPAASPSGRSDGKLRPITRVKLLHAVRELLLQLSDDERTAQLATLSAWARVASTPRPTHRPLSQEETRQLAASGLVEVGAHTRTHPVLARLAPAEQRAELVSSKRDLETILERPVTSFAYPFGAPRDYTPQTVELVRMAGFSRACSVFPGLVRRGTDPFQLPRAVVLDWDGEEFARRLKQWFRGWALSW